MCIGGEGIEFVGDCEADVNLVLKGEFAYEGLGFCVGVEEVVFGGWGDDVDVRMCGAFSARNTLGGLSKLRTSCYEEQEVNKKEFVRKKTKQGGRCAQAEGEGKLTSKRGVRPPCHCDDDKAKELRGKAEATVLEFEDGTACGMVQNTNFSSKGYELQQGSLQGVGGVDYDLKDGTNVQWIRQCSRTQFMPVRNNKLWS